MKTPARFLPLVVAAGVLTLPGARAAQPPAQPPALLPAVETRVETLNLGEILQGDWSATHANQAAGGGPLRVGGKNFATGFGTTGGSRLEISLDGTAGRIRAQTGVDETSGVLSTIRFLVVGDGRVLYRGPWQQRNGPAVALDIPLAGVRRLALVADVRGDGLAHGDWLEPVIVHAGAPPVAVAPVFAPDPLPPPPGALAPRINPPSRAGVRPGHPFLQRVNVAGTRPMQLRVDGLPAGLDFDAARQAIHGTAPVTPGDYPVQIHAENEHGQSSRTLHIVVGETIALTPPMGWSSWYCMSGKVSDAGVREVAAAMVANGLADHGWNYVNIDDFWMTRPAADSAILAQLREREATGRKAGYWKAVLADPDLLGPARDAKGAMLPNKRFPDMPALTAWLHARGFKTGLYSGPGVLTCGGCTGSFGHEAEDAAQFAAWGFDFLFYDWCSYYLETAGMERADWIKPYARMGTALRAQSRDIVFCLCEYGLAAVETWGREAGGQLWRTGHDVNDTWGSIAAAGFFNAERDHVTGPGSWNDLDQLMVGRIGFNHQLHTVRLAADERRTTFALWCLRGAPLRLAGDPRELDAAELALLTNDDAIAVNQDPLARPARRVVLSDCTEAWVRPLEGGAFAVGLFNRDEEATALRVDWATLIPPGGSWTVRDLWRGEPAEGVAAQGWNGTVPRHGVIFLRLDPVSPP